MIDSRDVTASRGVSIAGTAQLLTGADSRGWNEKIHRKYLSEGAVADPSVGPVFVGGDDVTIRITSVSVISSDMREIDRAAFGGAFQKHPDYFLRLEG